MNTDNVYPFVKEIFDNMCNSYQRIFDNPDFLPTNDKDNNRATGFTERNLTFNFCHSYLELNEKGVIWQEMPIIGQSHQHIDSVIVHSDTLLLIEAKRLHSPYHFEELTSSHFEELTSKPSLKKKRQHRTNPYGDLYRLQTYYKDIPIFDKQKYKACYAILLADFLIQRSNNKKTVNDTYHLIYKKYFDDQEYKVFDNDKMEYYLYYKVVPIITK